MLLVIAFCTTTGGVFGTSELIGIADRLYADCFAATSLIVLRFSVPADSHKRDGLYTQVLSRSSLCASRITPYDL